MSTASKEDAEKYSHFVRQQLGEALSRILAEIVDRRPLDPISYLAHKLYELRRKHPLPLQSVHMNNTSSRRTDTGRKFRSQRNQENDMSVIVVTNKPQRTKHFEKSVAESFDSTASDEAKQLLNMVEPQGSRTTNVPVTIPTRTTMLSTNDDLDDFIEDDLFERPSLSNIPYVHKLIVSQFKSIHDLFDDDDIT